MSGKTYTIVMLRHGESEYNKTNRFCGWFDADLSVLGNTEAESAGLVCKYFTNNCTYLYHGVKLH